MHVEIQHAGIKILADLHIARHQGSVRKRLRHVTAAGKTLLRIDVFPMGLFHAAELLRRHFLAREIFVALDFPAVGSRLDEVAGVGSVAPGRPADGA